MNRFLTTLALAAGIACAAFGYEPPRHNDTYTTNGVTYAQRGGLGAADYVVTNIDASAVGKVQSVNGKTGDISLDASDVGAATAEQGAKADAALSRAEAVAGFTEWNVTPTAPSGKFFYISAVQVYDYWIYNVWLCSAEGEWNDRPPDADLFPLSDHEVSLSFRINGVSYTATRTRLIPEKWALSNITNATGGAVSAADVRGIGIDYIAAPFERGRDYEEGDVVTINDRFYRFVAKWLKQWTGDPIEEGWVEELTDFSKLGGAVLAQKFLPLGYGGTNSATLKKIDAGVWNNKRTYFTIEPTGIGFEDGYGGKFEMIGDELRSSPTPSSHSSARIRDLLTYSSMRPIAEPYILDNNPTNGFPTSPFYVYSYLTNYYYTASEVSGKVEIAKATLVPNTRTINGASLSSNIVLNANMVGAMPSDAKIDKLYDEIGSRYISGDGSVWSKSAEDWWYAVYDNTTYDFAPYPEMGENCWRCASFIAGVSATLSYGTSSSGYWHLAFGNGAYTDAQGSIDDNSIYFSYFRGIPFTRYTSGGAFAYETRLAYTNDITIATNSLARTIPNNITRTANDATLVYYDGANARNLIYLRQATHSLAGLMKSTDKAALDTLVSTAVTRQTVTNVVDEVKELHYDDELGVTWETRIVGGEMKFFAVTNTNISVLGN